LSAKSIFIVTTSIFGSAFLGIFLSTIIFDGPSPDSEEFFENKSLEKSTIPKTETIIESPAEKEKPETIIESPAEKEKPETIIKSPAEKEKPETIIESPAEKEKPETQDSKSTESNLEVILSSSTSIELEGTITTSSSTGVE